LGKAKKVVQKLKEPLNEFASKGLEEFEKFLNIARGKVDVKNRLMLLLNPDNIKTSTRLTKAEMDFVALCYFMDKEFPIFEPLKEYAEEFMTVAISFNGLGREEAIRFTSAVSESKLLEKLNIFKTSESQTPTKA